MLYFWHLINSKYFGEETVGFIGFRAEKMKKKIRRTKSWGSGAFQDCFSDLDILFHFDVAMTENSSSTDIFKTKFLKTSSHRGPTFRCWFVIFSHAYLSQIIPKNHKIFPITNHNPLIHNSIQRFVTSQVKNLVKKLRVKSKS